MIYGGAQIFRDRMLGVACAWLAHLNEGAGIALFAVIGRGRRVSSIKEVMKPEGRIDRKLAQWRVEGHIMPMTRLAIEKCP